MATLASIAIGDVVTCTEEEEAYYSQRNGRPACFFTPGDIGVVGAVRVPYVRKTYPHGQYFVCVDFTKDGQTWRVGLDYAIIKKLTNAKEIADGLARC